ncbi:peroxiredoxin [Synechococcus sp. PH41509]|uniref:peroxiredoxin n=1 Tax=Synechococcus sp. PH41509 TaxID=2508342 RepID=UPI001D7FD50E|nr:peroxiredoxin [Synechococcus sp. PH41509]MCB4394252.1 peroxiredoxin [Synechococcus sp. PH41509]
MIEVGKKAPSFKAATDGNGSVALKDLKGKKVILYFYPKDDTPGCTAEACSFRDNTESFAALDAEVWGISGDDAVSHRRFATRHNLKFPLLCDRNNALRREMGVPKALGLLPGRVTYIVDGEGVIRHTFSNLLDGPAHVREAQQVLNQLRG